MCVCDTIPTKFLVTKIFLHCVYTWSIHFNSCFTTMTTRQQRGMRKIGMPLGACSKFPYSNNFLYNYLCVSSVHYYFFYYKLNANYFYIVKSHILKFLLQNIKKKFFVQTFYFVVVLCVFNFRTTCLSPNVLICHVMEL